MAETHETKEQKPLLGELAATAMDVPTTRAGQYEARVVLHIFDGRDFVPLGSAEGVAAWNKIVRLLHRTSRSSDLALALAAGPV